MWYMSALIVGVVGVSYASVPLYRMFCQVCAAGLPMLVHEIDSGNEWAFEGGGEGREVGDCGAVNKTSLLLPAPPPTGYGLRGHHHQT